MTNINEMFSKAQDAEDSDDFPDLLGPDELPTGEDVLVEIVYSKAGETKKGAPSFTNKVKVLEGPHKDGEFFDSIYLSMHSHSHNKRCFAKLAATGLGADFFASNPSTEAIAAAVKGKQVTVNVKWQKPAADGKVWGDHSWSPADEFAPADGPAGFGAATAF